MKFLLSLLTLLISLSSLAKPDKYKNADFKFTASVPKEWKLIANDTKPDKSQMMLGWEYPKVYSKLEKKEIANAVSILAYRDEDIKSVKDLITRQEAIEKNMGVCTLELDPGNRDSRIINCTQKGLRYKGKKQFFFKNGISYVVTFMASPGTYDINISYFKDFIKSLDFSLN